MKKYALLVLFIAPLAFSSCSKKTVPETAPAAATAPPKPVYKAPVKTPVPKSIVVSDAAAKTATNGRRYYDLEGKRYWRNSKDGKYYLYYKGMFDKPEFQ